MLNFKTMREVLSSLNNFPIYIAGHIKPDQDSVCSCLALAKWLNKNGKNAKVLLNMADFQIINWQGGSDLITDKVVHEKYCFIALDVNEMKRLGEFYEDFKKAQLTINIDHHQGNDCEADYVFSRSELSSTCEIIYQITRPRNRDLLDVSFYELIYSGMMNDTNCFSRRLSKRTLAIAQKVINKGVDYSNIIKQTFSNRSLYQYKALAKIVNEMQFDGFYYSVITFSLIFSNSCFLPLNKYLSKKNTGIASATIKRAQN